jgi:hypothetical protein
MPDRMYSPSPTVAASPVPFYLRGGAPGLFNPYHPHTAALIDSGIDPDTADLIFGAVANGKISKHQFEQILSGEMSHDDLETLLFGVAGTQVPSASSAGQGLFNILETALSGLGQPLIDYTDTAPIDYTSPSFFETSIGLPTPTNYVMQSSESPINYPNYVLQSAEAPPFTPSYDPTIYGDITNPKFFELTSAPQYPAAPASTDGTTAAQGSTAAAIANAAAAAVKAIQPAPRVATTIPTIPASPLKQALTKSSIISGVPDFAVIGLGLLGLAAIAGGRR